MLSNVQKITSAFERTGIGLAIVKLAMDKLKGQVSIESKGKGGSCFVLELPKKSE